MEHGLIASECGEVRGLSAPERGLSASQRCISVICLLSHKEKP